MSKNKNPLKDLDLFLKQQASSFVNPTPLSEKIEAEPKAPSAEEPSTGPAITESLLETMERMMDQNPSALYDLLIQAAEKKTSAERTLLINTALYLKNTSNWKEAVLEYWKNRN